MTSSPARTLSLRASLGGGLGASFAKASSQAEAPAGGSSSRAPEMDKRSSLTRLQHASLTSAVQLAAAAAAATAARDGASPKSGTPTNEPEDAAAAARAGGDEQDEDLAAMGGFVKTLSSDLSEAESLLLLQRVQAAEPLFRGFDASELEMLAHVLSVLHFVEGDKIISKSESATFCGIVLNGTFNAIVSANVVVPLALGSMIGGQSGGGGRERRARTKQTGSVHLRSHVHPRR